MWIFENICLQFVDLLPGGQILSNAFCIQDSFWRFQTSCHIPSALVYPIHSFFLLINLKIGTSLNLTNRKEIILLFCPVNKLCPNINPVHEKQRDGMFTSMKLLCPFTQITKFNWSEPFIAVFYCIQYTDIFFVNFWRTSVLLWGH